MIQKMLYFIVYFFSQPSVLGISLAVIFGAIWLVCYRPPMFKKPWLWAVLAGGAILAPIAMAFTAVPLRIWVSQTFGHFWSRETLEHWSLLASVPSIFLFGLVREGAKLLPVVAYWWYRGWSIDVKLGLAAGAVAGAGFGILESQWVHNQFISFYSWNWELVQIHGFEALVGFWEGFFMLGINVASTALAGWGLAKGWGWQFYLVAASVYLVAQYNSVLLSAGLVSSTQVELILAAWALLVTGVALWLREREAEA